MFYWICICKWLFVCLNLYFTIVVVTSITGNGFFCFYGNTGKKGIILCMTGFLLHISGILRKKYAIFIVFIFLFMKCNETL